MAEDGSRATAKKIAGLRKVLSPINKLLTRPAIYFYITAKLLNVKNQTLDKTWNLQIGFTKFSRKYRVSKLPALKAFVLE